MALRRQVIVSQDPVGIQIKPQGGEAGNVLVGNLPACNAVVHIVDRVLLPNLARTGFSMRLQDRVRCSA